MVELQDGDYKRHVYVFWEEFKWFFDFDALRQTTRVAEPAIEELLFPST